LSPGKDWENILNPQGGSEETAEAGTVETVEEVAVCKVPGDD
jgi:hypothetical protein